MHIVHIAQFIGLGLTSLIVYGLIGRMFSDYCESRNWDSLAVGSLFVWPAVLIGMILFIVGRVIVLSVWRVFFAPYGRLFEYCGKWASKLGYKHHAAAIERRNQKAAS